MIPKKAKDFIKPTADELGISEDLVNDLSSFFWSDVRKAIVDMRGTNIYVPSLGTFKVKPWQLEEVIKKYQDYIDLHNQKVAAGENISFSRYSILRDVQANLEKTLKVREMINNNLTKKQSIKDKRNGKKSEGSI